MWFSPCSTITVQCDLVQITPILVLNFPICKMVLLLAYHTIFSGGGTHWFWVSIYQHHNGTVHFQQVQAEVHASSRCWSIPQTKSWVIYKLSIFEDVSIIWIYRAYKFWRLLCKLEGLVNEPWENFALCILMTGESQRSLWHSSAVLAQSQFAAGGSWWYSVLQRQLRPGACLSGAS